MDKHVPTPAQMQKMQELTSEFDRIEQLIKMLCPDSRERALAVTNLEQSLLWADKSILKAK